jgi:hypothetical protein
MYTPSLHAEIATVVNGEDCRFFEELCEWKLSISAVRTDNLHTLIYTIEHGLGHERLAHRANHLTMIVMAIEIMSRLPNEVPARFNSRRDVT